MPLTPRATSGAGGFDSQFGVDSSRTTPSIMVVETTSVYDSTTGYSWAELRANPGSGGFVAPTLPLTGQYAFDVSGSTSLPIGTRGSLFIDRDQTVYALIVDATDPLFSLTVEEQDGSPSVTDVTTLQFHQSDGFVVSQPVAGTALVRLTGTPINLTVREVDGTPSVNPVNTIEFLQSNGFVVTDQGGGVARIAFVPLSANYGCGLDVVAGVVVLDLTGVALPPLAWDNGACELSLTLGCHLAVDADDALYVTTDTLAGDNTETALVEYPNAPPACNWLAFDQTIVTTVPITYVTDVTADVVGTVLTIAKTRQTITDNYNAANVIVSRTYGTPATTTELEYDLCDPCCPCLEPGSQEYTASGDYTFTANCTGLHRIEAIGPGGTGTGHTGDEDPSQAGGGGGAYARVDVCLEDGTEYAVHVGAGGSESDTTFDITLIAAAGKNAVIAVPGAGGQVADSLGDVVFAGGDGGLGAGVNGGGGGGGGAGDDASAGGDGANAVGATGGAGGAAGTGGASAGAGGAGGNNGAAGTNGANFGGGGGGSGFQGVTAGTGAGGWLKITW